MTVSNYLCHIFDLCHLKKKQQHAIKGNEITKILKLLGNFVNCEHAIFVTLEVLNFYGYLVLKGGISELSSVKHYRLSVITYSEVISFSLSLCDEC